MRFRWGRADSTLGLLAMVATLSACHLLLEYSPPSEPADAASDGAAGDTATAPQPDSRSVDQRSAPPDLDLSFATRLSSTGAVVRGKQSLAIAAAELGFVVVWAQVPPLDTGTSPELELWLALIGEDGSIARHRIGALDAPLDLLRVYARGDLLDVFFRYEDVSGGIDHDLTHHWVLNPTSAGWTYQETGTYFGERGAVFPVLGSSGGSIAGYAILGESPEMVTGHQWALSRFKATVIDLQDSILQPEEFLTPIEGYHQRQAQGASLGDMVLFTWRNVSDSPDRIYWLTGLKSESLPWDDSSSPASLETTGDQGRPMVVVDGQGRPWLLWEERGAVFAMLLKEDPTSNLSWQRQWETPRQLIPANRYESMDFDCASTASALACIWESDQDSPTTQILVGQTPLADTPSVGELPATRISHLLFEYCCPKLAANDQSWGAVFLGSVQGEQGVYFTTLAPGEF